MNLEELLATMPFAVATGVLLTQADKAECVGRLEHASERTTLGGALHGGALMTLADSVGAVCAFLNLPDGAGTSTLSSATNLLRGVREGYVEAVSRPLHDRRRHRGARSRGTPRQQHDADPSGAELRCCGSKT